MILKKFPRFTPYLHVADIHDGPGTANKYKRHARADALQKYFSRALKVEKYHALSFDATADDAAAAIYTVARVWRIALPLLLAMLPAPMTRELCSMLKPS